MADAAEDADVQLAIKLSLEGMGSPPATRAPRAAPGANAVVIDLDSESEEPAGRLKEDAADLGVQPATAALSTSTGIRGLDRKAMERERLARL
ncbi:MAG: hypothetical protein INR71_14440, partial [Terriglobus roseus]|nr:hypothetical protein [Terriglobus roseus]